MMLAQVGLFEILSVAVYLAVTAYLGWLGWRHTKSAADYMVGGRTTHPFIMALSYGATFISTSAIVGFGGVAGQLGMGLLWLVFLNIFVGIFIAFVFLGSPTRRMGHRLDAHTFPELLGRRFQSRGIQVLVGLVIFAFMPLYAAAVIIGGCKFIALQFGTPYNVALLAFVAIVAIYVFYGGLKGVMYTDALQGAIMVVGMLVLLGVMYVTMGGLTSGHQRLTDLASLVPAGLTKVGHNGWTAMPDFGWGSGQYNLWWTVVSTITLGVGIGVLAQPQLVVRFMTVKSRRDLNRAVVLGGLFILLIPGSAYVVGSMSNAYFADHGPVLSGPAQVTDADKGFATMTVTGVEKSALDGDLQVTGQKVAVVLQRDSAGQFVHPGGDESVFAGRGIMAAYTAKEVTDPVTGAKKVVMDAEETIPRYIKLAMPAWFGSLFLLTLLSAAMSTLSGQLHALGTSIGRDVYEQVSPRHDNVSHNRSLHVVRVGMLVGIVLATTIAWYAEYAHMDKLIMRATAIFFGLCTSTFLPAFVGALFFRRMTKAGALASMVVGFSATAFWLVFVKAKEAAEIGLVGRFLPKEATVQSILGNYPNWPEVDPLLVAFPLSILAAVVVSMLTRPPGEEHLRRCFED